MSDPWIRVHANLAQRPVIWRLADHLGISKHEAMGLLAEFWGNVSQHAKNGQISHLADSHLEAWADWRGERGLFADFIRSQHVDADGRVKEWDEYHGKLELRRESDRKRKEIQRKSAGSPVDVTRTVRTTIRDETKPTTKEDPSASQSDKQTWLTPVCDQWERANGAGSFGTIAGQAAKALAPLRKAGQEPTIIAQHLHVYLALNKPPFWSITKFAQTFHQWEPKDMVEENGGLTQFGLRMMEGGQ